MPDKNLDLFMNDPMAFFDDSITEMHTTANTSTASVMPRVSRRATRCP